MDVRQEGTPSLSDVIEALPALIDHVRHALDDSSTWDLQALRAAVYDLPSPYNPDDDECEEEVRFRKAEIIAALDQPNTDRGKLMEFVAWRVAVIAYMCTSIHDDEILSQALTLMDEAVELAIKGSENAGELERAREAREAVINGDMGTDGGPKWFVPTSS